MDNESRLDDPTFSRCSLGNGRWFWVTWADFESICEGRPHGTGVASSAAEAEKQASDSLTAAFGSREFLQHSTNYARHVHRRMAIKNRAGRSCQATRARPIGVRVLRLMQRLRWQNGHYSSPHRVVKKTSTRVYVEIPCRIVVGMKMAQRFTKLIRLSWTERHWKEKECAYSRRQRELLLHHDV